MKLSKIFDISREDQTDAIKSQLYQLVRQFVYKNQKHYYPHFRGDIDDLIHDIYISLMTAKSRVKGNEQSLLDKWDPNRLDLPSLVKVSVIRKLIDRERTDKQEVNYSERYDEETGQLSLDWLANKIDSRETQLEDIEFTDDELLELRDKYDEMDPEAREEFLKYYYEVKDVLPENFAVLFQDLVGKDLPKDKKSVNSKIPYNSATLEVAEEVSSKLPDLDVQIKEHKVSSGSALRCTFENLSNVSEEELKEFSSILSKDGWGFYSRRGNNLYFTK